VLRVFRVLRKRGSEFGIQGYKFTIYFGLGLRVNSVEFQVWV
jgi:hypothetical protein